MPSNPFDEFFPQQQAGPQATVSEAAPTAAPTQAAGNPFDEFFGANQNRPPAGASTAPAAATTPNPAATPDNPFSQFFPTVGNEARTVQEHPGADAANEAAASTPTYEERFGEGESVLSRPISTYFGIPEYREGAGGVERGIEKFASALTSPVSLALMIATAGTTSLASAGASLAEAGAAGLAGGGEATAETVGMKMLNWAAEKWGADAATQIGNMAGTIDKVASAGFALDQIRGFAAQVPQIQSDIKSGDWDAAQEHITTAGLGAVFAAASVNHLINKFGETKYNWTPDNKAIGQQQGSIELAKFNAKIIEKTNQPILEKAAASLSERVGAEISAHDLDVAAKWYHEAGGLKNESADTLDTMSTLENFKKRVEALTNLSPRDKALQLKNITLAMNLPQEVRDMAEGFRPFYEQHWERLKTAGLVHPDAEAREHYAGNRQYNPEDETQNAFRPAEGLLRASKKPGALKPRSFDNMVDAIEKGYVPKQIGMMEAASNYERVMGAAHGLANAEKVFLQHDDIDGRPVAIDPARIRNIDSITDTGRSIKIPAVRIDDISGIDHDLIKQDPDGKFWLDVSDYTEGPKIFKRFRVTDVAFEKGPDGGPAVDSEGNFIEKPIRKQTALFFHPDHLERANQAFEDSSWVRKTPWMNAVLKGSQAAKKTLLALSPFHYVTEGLRGLQTGLSLHEIFHPDEINPDGLAVKQGTTHGLVLYGEQLERSAYRAAAADSEGSGGGGLISKIPYLRDIQDKAEEHLFGNWLPRMKAVAFEKMAGDLREQNPNWGNEQVYSTAARLTNATFGGMNWRQLGVSANTVDLLRILALAPDFTGSQVDYTMQAFKPGGSVVAKSFGRMMAYNFLVAQALNLMIHGTVHMDHPFGVVGPDDKKVWNMRTMPEDVWRSLTEPASFAKNRLNPLVKTGVEILYDRNDQGKKMSNEQLVGDAIRNVSPISLQGAGAEFLRHFVPDISKKFKTGNQEDSFTDSALRAVGIAPTANRTAAETLASQRLNDRLPSGISDPSQVARHHKVLDAADQIRSGHSVDLHEFTAAERRQILTAGREDLLRSKFGRLNMGDALDVWKIATQEEKQKLLMDLLKKKNSYVNKLSTSERESDDTYQRLKAMGLVKH